MSDKKTKLKARLPRGLRDRGPAEIAATRRMVATIQEVYERYGFEPVETPAVEFTDALGKFLPDLDRPNEGVFSFKDDDEQWLSLRYDLTAPLARYFAENADALPRPYRSYRVGWVFRNEKPGPGRFRQFMQFDADTVGSASPAADAEICMMAADAMEALGFKRGEYVVKVNNRKVLDGIREAIGVSDDKQWLTVMRAIDKLDRLGIGGVRELLGVGRVDASGDKTEGAGLAEKQIERILRFFQLNEVWALADNADSFSAPNENAARSQSSIESSRYDDELKSEPMVGRYFSNADVISSFEELVGQSDIGRSGLDELHAIVDLSAAGGYGSGRIRIDPSVVRGLEYYTGPVFEVELLLDTKDEKGRPVRFGSVGGGGRYDGLVSRFRGEAVPATGFSIGVSRLQAALALIDKDVAKPLYGPVVVTVFGGEIADYQKMVATLRHAGIRAELYLGNPKHSLGQQMKYADKRNSPVAIIQGSDEKARGEVLIKDLIAGAQLGGDAAQREDYLKAQAQAQFSAADSGEGLVKAVRDVLDKHRVRWE